MSQKIRKASVGPAGEAPKVTYEDQMKINLFAQYNMEHNEMKSQLEGIRKLLESLEDAESEMMMVDDDMISFQIGEIFVDNDMDATQILIDKRRKSLEKRQEGLKEKEEQVLKAMKDLKVFLYDKFGDNISLEN